MRRNAPSSLCAHPACESFQRGSVVHVGGCDFRMPGGVAAATHHGRECPSTLRAAVCRLGGRSPAIPQLGEHATVAPALPLRGRTSSDGDSSRFGAEGEACQRLGRAPGSSAVAVSLGCRVAVRRRESARALERVHHCLSVSRSQPRSKMTVTKPVWGIGLRDGLRSLGLVLRRCGLDSQGPGNVWS